MGATPNWVLDYIPSPSEWNGLWAGKADDSTALASLLALNNSSPRYANDTAAGAGGVPIGSFYLNGNIVQKRLT